MEGGITVGPFPLLFRQFECSPNDPQARGSMGIERGARQKDTRSVAIAWPRRVRSRGWSACSYWRHSARLLYNPRPQPYVNPQLQSWGKIQVALCTFNGLP